MGLSSPQAAASIATTLVAIGVAYYYLLRKNEPPAREPSPSTTTETSTDLASTREVDRQPQSSVVWRAMRAASRWSIGGTAIGAYEEFSPITASKTSSPASASPVPPPSTTATATAGTVTNSTAPAASDLAASDAVLLATLASPATAASTAEALARLAA